MERWPRVTRAFAGVCFVYVCCWNIRGVAPSFGQVFPQKINAFGLVLRLDQYWAMFAPAPVAVFGQAGVQVLEAETLRDDRNMAVDLGRGPATGFRRTLPRFIRKPGDEPP